jgi:DnaJ-class molecular chaperone
MAKKIIITEEENEEEELEKELERELVKEIAKEIVRGEQKSKFFEVSCGYCEGKGQVYLSTCKVCGGTRVLRLPGDRSDYTTCSKCDGKGTLYAQLCPLCGGTGLIKKF